MYSVFHKCLLLGPSGVGKSTFLYNCVERCPGNGTIHPTVGVGKCIVPPYLIWDASGSEKYRAIVSMYYKNTEIKIFMYDITSLPSFKDIHNWIKGVPRESTDTWILIGNKLDCVPNRKVSTTKGRSLAKHYNMHFHEISAHQHVHIHDIFSKKRGGCFDFIKVPHLLEPWKINI